MSNINYPSETTQVRDASNNLINPAKEDGNLAGIKSDLDTINTNTPAKGQANSAGSSPVVIASDQSAIPVTSTPNFATRADTFTVAGNGVTVDKHTAPVSSFALQIKGTGAAATAWDIVLEASLDGTNFTTILEHTTAVGDGQTMYTGELDSPALYFRSRLVSVTLGSATNIVVTILGV